MDFRIVSIGTLPSHPYWNEPNEIRTGHATTTVIKHGDRILLVDPSLPAQVIDAKLHERWGMRVSEITDVFLTSFDPDRRRALDGLAHANWLMHAPEIESSKVQLQEELSRVERDDELEQWLTKQLQLLDECNVPDDRIMDGVDLFPLHGYTDGTCGLLLPTPKQTIVIAGDAVPTSEHLARLTVSSNCRDIEAAQESMKECIEIADIIVPGRDNVMLNPIRT